MSRGKRFESARRLCQFGLDKPNTRNSGSPCARTGGFLIPLLYRIGGVECVEIQVVGKRVWFDDPSHFLFSSFDASRWPNFPSEIESPSIVASTIDSRFFQDRTLGRRL
jgi:hypothetical protein